jgi:RNase P subunit RPR2
MTKLYCDGCEEQLITAENMKIPQEKRQNKSVDLCNDCLRYMQKEIRTAFERLQANPKKYKLKYDEI